MLYESRSLIHLNLELKYLEVYFLNRVYMKQNLAYVWSGYPTRPDKDQFYQELINSVLTGTDSQQTSWPII